MKTILIILITCLVHTTIFTQNVLQNGDRCHLSLADIERVFGKGFKEEESSQFGEMISCRFTNSRYTIHINLEPAYGMKIDDYHKMMSPKTVIWQTIPNDPDGAAIEVRDDSKDDLASTPAIAYIRNNKYVRLQILGNYYNYESNQMITMREKMRQNLTTLKRIP